MQTTLVIGLSWYADPCNPNVLKRIFATTGILLSFGLACRLLSGYRSRECLKKTRNVSGTDPRHVLISPPKGDRAPRNKTHVPAHPSPCSERFNDCPGLKEQRIVRLGAELNHLSSEFGAARVLCCRILVVREAFPNMQRYYLDLTCKEGSRGDLLWHCNAKRAMRPELHDRSGIMTGRTSNAPAKRLAHSVRT